MIISHPEPQPYEVKDYDITFANGIFMTISVADDLGDTVDFDTSPMAVQFHLAEKPSPTNPEARLPPEDITVLMSHVIMITKRTRLVTPPSKEEQDHFRQTLFTMNKTIQ